MITDLQRIFQSRETRAVSAEVFKKKYAYLEEKFCQKALAMGYGDLKKYYWYHTIDLGNGLVTPGHFDYRSNFPLFCFPKDMTGLNVLDIGSATGFFSFEFEKRGANVISVEVPSIADYDALGKDRKQALKKFMIERKVSTIEELQHFHLDAPFEFCKKVLNSKVKRCHSLIYDLTAEKLGIDAFDIVFIGDVLLHLFSPFRALISIAPLCRGTLVLSQEIAITKDPGPLMKFMGKRNIVWWLPNMPCFEQMLNRLGFRNVKIVGYHKGVHSFSGGVYKRAIIHATK